MCIALAHSVAACKQITPSPSGLPPASPVWLTAYDDILWHWECALAYTGSWGKSARSVKKPSQFDPLCVSRAKRGIFRISAQIKTHCDA